jgi:hypothetical protein
LYLKKLLCFIDLTSKLLDCIYPCLVRTLQYLDFILCYVELFFGLMIKLLKALIRGLGLLQGFLCYLVGVLEILVGCVLFDLLLDFFEFLLVQLYLFVMFSHTYLEVYILFLQ